ncbi:MAG: EAL domain-containing protein [Clostridia bacterium]|jgi:diguanylate cyclase (GGDEF)-like protein|nr:EAL domain-containing protein [Clostridia bacterium]MCI2001094.1 EAL domain-containing protein [Clostridia bacterium]MCI2015780.1 EAL domain-containing protein [Clostridia bacterium]
MPVSKTILLIDDNAVNRKILARILSSDYNTVEAENGKEALNILKSGHHQISGIILDLVMPEMNGFEFLSIVSKVQEYKNIPVIISTANGDEKNEIRALKLSAWDFVSKPYNPKIIKFRLKNAIERSQLSAFEQLKYLAEFDTLTGIYNRTRFYSLTHEMLISNYKRKFVIVRFDINRFKLINSFYGSDEGDNLLKYIAKKLREMCSTLELASYGRIEGDVFAFCTLYKGHNSISSTIENLTSEIKHFKLSFDIVLTYGIYVIEDNYDPVDTFLDKAALTAKHIKGDYVKFYEFYTPDMSLKIEKEQLITNMMNDALNNEQFIIYFQPKYNLATNSPAGAEALVRWKHPTKGILPPGEFIPVFERNGFITKLDQYVWEKACQYLRKWLDAGLVPVPISVNVSRVDICNPNLVDILFNITKKYNIPTNLLHLELTESAYTDNPLAIKLMLKNLHDHGFLVMMDDFGSGYSSLNILKELPVDVLKIDMHFLSGAEIPGRSETIIAAIIRMAKWLKIPVIAEGVETKEQADFLSQIGCEYVQGYYFAKPMPIEKYEELISNKKPEFIEPEHDGFDISQILRCDVHIEKIFCKTTQPICIYEYSNDTIELIRVNSAFHKEFGFGDMQAFVDVLKNVHNDYRQRLLDCFAYAVKTRGSSECEFLQNYANNNVWIKLKLKYFSFIANRHILFGILLNITSIKEIDEEIDKYKTNILKNNQNINKPAVNDNAVSKNEEENNNYDVKDINTPKMLSPS